VLPELSKQCKPGVDLLPVTEAEWRSSLNVGSQSGVKSGHQTLLNDILCCEPYRVAATSELVDNTDRQGVDREKQFSGTVVSELQNVVSQQLPAEDIIMFLGSPDDAIFNVPAADVTEYSTPPYGTNTGVLCNVVSPLLPLENFTICFEPVSSVTDTDIIENGEHRGLVALDRQSIETEIGEQQKSSTLQLPVENFIFYYDPDNAVVQPAIESNVVAHEQTSDSSLPLPIVACDATTSGSQVYVKPLCKSGTKTVRNKVKYCKYCEKGVKRMGNHLLKHVEESEVIALRMIPKGSAARRKRLQLLANEGNFKHNATVLRQLEKSL
jgi:hypothetical protein